MPGLSRMRRRRPAEFRRKGSPGYSSSGRSSPGHVPVVRANARRL